MSRKGFFEMSFPKGICVCNLSSPLAFVGLTRFVSAILEGEPQKLSLSISKTTTRPLRAICQQCAAADRLFRRGILPLLVVPEGGDQVNRHFQR